MRSKNKLTAQQANARDNLPDAEGHIWVELSSAPKGEYIRFKINGTVWARGEYDRSVKKYSACKVDDCNHESFKRGNTLVLVGFSY